MAFTHQSNLPALDSSSHPPNLSDGGSRLYVAFLSPFAQRAWIARNYKCPSKIDVIAINLSDKPKWYTEKVYPVGKVPSLEDKGKVIGESLDIMEYIDQNFEGPALYPQDAVKKEAVKELIAGSDSVITEVFRLGKNKEFTKSDAEKAFDPLFDKLEAALGKFEVEGPFLTGQFGAADAVYGPLLERSGVLLPDLLDYDVYAGRPKLAKWWKTINTEKAFSSTTCEPQVILKMFKMFMGR